MSLTSKQFWYKRSIDGHPDKHFSLHEDTYGGAVIDLHLSSQLEDTSSSEIDLFRRRFQHTLTYLESEKFNKGVWVRIDRQSSRLIPILIEEFDFDFHHAESMPQSAPVGPHPSTDTPQSYVMMCKWLSSTEPNTLPISASHTVGVGAVILNDDNILLVKEVSGPAAALGVWKIPTGRVDVGETLSDALIREVKEEIGIDVKVQGIFAIREGHMGVDYLGKKSDIFAVGFCHIQSPTGSQGQSTETSLVQADSSLTDADSVIQPSAQPIELKLQQNEIAEAKWVPVGELLNYAKPKSSNEYLYSLVQKIIYNKPDSFPYLWSPAVLPSARINQPHTWWSPIGISRLINRFKI